MLGVWGLEVLEGWRGWFDWLGLGEGGGDRF